MGSKRHRVSILFPVQYTEWKGGSFLKIKNRINIIGSTPLQECNLPSTFGPLPPPPIPSPLSFVDDVDVDVGCCVNAGKCLHFVSSLACSRVNRTARQ